MSKKWTRNQKIAGWAVIIPLIISILGYWLRTSSSPISQNKTILKDSTLQGDSIQGNKTETNNFYLLNTPLDNGFETIEESCTEDKTDYLGNRGSFYIADYNCLEPSQAKGLIDVKKGFDDQECKDLKFHIQNPPGNPGLPTSSWIAVLEDKNGEVPLICTLTETAKECESNKDEIVKIEGSPILRIISAGNPNLPGTIAFSLKCRWPATHHP